jgi:zinc/manganese transport system permease protein
VDTDLSILAAPFAAGLLVLATHVPLGRQVLMRGIVFIDLAIAQVAGLGVIAASLSGLDLHGMGAQAAAVVAALAAALLLTWTEKRWPKVQEALIGVLFVLAACVGILLLAHDPHGGEALRELLAGQILWVRFDQLTPSALASVLVLAIWFSAGPRLPRFGFYALFSLAVTASVQLVGVYLVFASLIVPALGALAWPAQRRLAVAYAIGIAAYAIGLLLSLRYDWPAGALIVLVLALLAATAALLTLLARPVDRRGDAVSREEIQ